MQQFINKAAPVVLIATLALAGCSSSARTKLPQVAGTYEGIAEVVSSISDVFQRSLMRAEVVQTDADVEIKLLLNYIELGWAPFEEMWTGKIDKDGKFTPAEEFVAIPLADSECGDQTPTDISGSFADDKFSFSTVGTTENCGTITVTFIAEKT